MRQGTEQNRRESTGAQYRGGDGHIARDTMDPLVPNDSVSRRLAIGQPRFRFFSLKMASPPLLVWWCIADTHFEVTLAVFTFYLKDFKQVCLLLPYHPYH